MTRNVGFSSSLGPNIKVAILTAGPSSGVLGGAERFYKGLVGGFSEIGCSVELISVPANERTFEEILGNYKTCWDMDLSSYDVVISTKAPTYAVQHPRHVMYLVHTVRVFDDMFYDTFPSAGMDLYVERSKLHRLDFTAMERIKAKFTIGHEVSNRLYRWRGLTSEVLHPPLGIEGFKSGDTGDYFFMPGRLHPWKRIHLVIESVLRSSQPLRLVIAGTGEAEAELKRQASGDPRIEFLGRVDDDKLIDLYAGALAVPFVPLREDYGYVTLEAFASSKAVITCCDSGEPTFFVRNGDTGLICKPDAESLREAMEWIFAHRTDAQEMGRKGQALTAEMSWTAVANRLLEAAYGGGELTSKTETKVTVLDMQPIDPPTGGGRLRLLGLYHNLGSGVPCQYVGSYDWPGERYRRHHLSPGLEEIDVPLSGEHHAAAHALRENAGGKTVIDISFGRMGQLSTDYLDAARSFIRNADVVIFSHPWVYPLVSKELAPGQVVIYDSQNVEGYLRAQLLDEDNPCEQALLREVIQDEYAVGRRADLILCCSHEDLELFQRIYDFSPEKMRIAPNGVMAFTGKEITPQEKSKARRRLALDNEQLIAIFIGSSYGPNIEAAHFITEQLSLAMHDVVFVIAGGVGAGISTDRANVIITGPLGEKDKTLWLCASDLAVNPMFSGSGTNIKMFDFMAMRLPTVTTAVGARGISTCGRKAMMVVEPSVAAYVEAIDSLRDANIRSQIGNEARICVEEGYAWERISELTGRMIAARKQYIGQPQPAFSVVVPSYERHEQLNELISRLQLQIERDFEVIIIDQSASRWQKAENDYGFPLLYFHSPVKGAVRARNTGASLAQGSVIAFTDDDCLPSETWLLNARRYFGDQNICGVEGIIVSDHLDDPEWRPVTNVNFEGLGFMTANLMIRSRCFHQLGGFDLDFDRPHFREDTDLGWRLQKLGKVPYAHDVEVFHPAQPRSIGRESSVERIRFFEKDALLYKKHPERYRELFFRERHYEVTPGFTDNFRRGFMQYGVEIPGWLKPHLK